MKMKNLSKRAFDVYDLINSKDIATYCRKIKHQFNIIETGVIIHRSKKISLKKKVECFKYLIEHYHDMEVLERKNCKYYASFKELLRERIKFIKRIINIFEQVNDECVYMIDFYYEGDESYSNYETIFSSLEKVQAYLYKDIREMKEFFDGDNKLLKYRIKKIWLNSEYKRMTFENNQKHEYMSFTFENILDDNRQSIEAIDNIWIDIPTPFKRGDILSAENKLIVMDWISNVDKGIPLQFKDKDLTEYRGLKWGGSDMLVFGYYMIDKVNVGQFDNMPYDILEYYHGKLYGNKRLLKKVSRAIKLNEIMFKECE